MEKVILSLLVPLEDDLRVAVETAEACLIEHTDAERHVIEERRYIGPGANDLSMFAQLAASLSTNPAHWEDVTRPGGVVALDDVRGVLHRLQLVIAELRGGNE